MNPRIYLKPNKERPILARHPWVFSGAIARADPAAAGSTVDLYTSRGEFLARGYYNAKSQIAARVWTLEDRPVDRAFLADRIRRARATREMLGLGFGRADAQTTAFRLVNAESDLLPGLIVDVYGDFLVVQVLTAGIALLKAELASILEEEFHPRGIYERSDVEVRQKEGLAEEAGSLAGAAPPPLVEIRENGLAFLVDVARGHKTGFYLDQRENRARTAGLLASFHPDQPAQVLNAFAYTGAFGIALASVHPRAQVVNLDASADSLALARGNFARNGVADRAEYLAGDAFAVLRQFRDARRAFDVIVLDPPKFAYSQGQLNAACRGYKDLNLLACKLLRSGGLLVTFSCSGLVSPELFQKVVSEAALDAGRDAQVLARLGHAADHPVLLSFPEGEYLKGLILEVL